MPFILKDTDSHTAAANLSPTSCRPWGWPGSRRSGDLSAVWCQPGYLTANLVSEAMFPPPQGIPRVTLHSLCCTVLLDYAMPCNDHRIKAGVEHFYTPIS